MLGFSSLCSTPWTETTLLSTSMGSVSLGRASSATVAACVNAREPASSRLSASSSAWVGGQPAVPQQVRDLLERHVLREVGDHVSAIDEPAVGPVHHRDCGLGGDDALKAWHVGAAHLAAIGTGFNPGAGPVHSDAGRMIRRSASDSSTCAVQPTTREVANRQVNISLGMPAPVSTTEAQKSTLVAFGRSGCAS